MSAQNNFFDTGQLEFTGMGNSVTRMFVCRSRYE